MVGKVDNIRTHTRLHASTHARGNTREGFWNIYLREAVDILSEEPRQQTKTSNGENMCIGAVNLDIQYPTLPKSWMIFTIQ